MPYISIEARETLARVRHPNTGGELNYCITKMCDEYLVANGLCYRHINEVIGVLECAKLEFYRRIASPYEDEKKTDNGDVYSKENIV